jgi:tetratricopeptide (TPR) repeat protein
MQIDVFISFNHEDEVSAKLLCGLLEKQGLTTWFAPRDIQMGANYASKIFEAIENASVFSVLISKNSSNSFHVKNEIELASRQIERGIQIMPILLDKEKLDGDIQYYLSRQQWLDASQPPIVDNLYAYCNYIKLILNKEQLPALQELKLYNEIAKSIETPCSYKDFAILGNFQMAIELLEKDIAQHGKPTDEVDSELSHLYNEFGFLQKQIRAYDESILTFQKALKYAPEHASPSIHYNLGSVYMDIHEFIKAEEEFSRALSEERMEFGQSSSATWYARSNAFFNMGDFAKAQSDYEHAQQLDRQYRSRS